MVESNVKNIKVLIADDEYEILNIMAKRIHAEGYTVIAAQDGEDAWNKIKKDSPDIIVLDLTMPKMDGFSVLKKLREEPPSDKWQPVIIVSARGELEDIQQGLMLEAEHYIIKPCQMDDIIKGIQLMQNLIPSRKSDKDTVEENS